MYNIKHHRLFSIFLYAIGIAAFLIGYSLGLMVIPTFIGFFCCILGWYQWKLSGPKGPVDKETRAAYEMLKIFIAIIMYILAAVLFIVAIINDEIMLPCIGFSVLCIAFGALEWKAGNPEKTNSDVMGLMQVEELETEMSKIFADFKDVDTILGKPWLSHVSTITDRDCIIWGPTRSGAFVFGYYLSGIFQLSNSEDISWIRDQEAANAHIISEVTTSENQGMSNYSLDMEIRVMVNFYYQMLKNYALTGIAAWPNNKADDVAKGKFYAFDESFSWTKQVYHLLDNQGNVVFNVEGTLPLKTFRISDPVSGNEIFKITKRLVHVMDHYDFYYMGQPFGQMAQKIDWLHDRFELDTAWGHIKMQSDNASLGNNYYVYINNEMIGTIGQKLGLRIRNAVFDNYVIRVYNEKYLALMAGMAIMAEREHKRDVSAARMS